MVVLIYLLIAVGGFISLIGSLWFLKVAFHTHFGWGLACLLIPFGALVFLIVNWRKSRSPFLVSLVGYLVTLIAVAGLAAHSASSAVRPYADVTYGDAASLGDTSSGEYWLEDQSVVDLSPTPSFEPQTELEPEPAPELETIPAADPEESIDEAVAQAETPEIRPTPSRRRDLPWGVAVSYDTLHTYIGRTIEIHMKDGKDFKAELSGVGDGSIMLIERVGGGIVEFALPLSDIAQIRVKRR